MGAKSICIDSEFTIVGARTSSIEHPAWFADVYVIDPGAVVTASAQDLVRATARLSPTVVLSEHAEEDRDRFLTLGAQAVLSTCAPAHRFVETVRRANAGLGSDPAATDPAPAAAGNPPAEVGATDQAAGLDQLSPRELQVLHCIARGMTHFQISRRLDISRHTVDTYVKRIRAKIGAGNKAELTRASLLGQMLPAPTSRAM